MWEKNPRHPGHPVDFCVRCGSPAPRVSRKQLLGWLKDRLVLDKLDPATRLSLQKLVDTLADMDANDTKTVTTWNTLKEKAPKAMKAARPYLPHLIGQGVQTLLDWRVP